MHFMHAFPPFHAFCTSWACGDALLLIVAFDALPAVHPFGIEDVTRDVPFLNLFCMVVYSMPFLPALAPPPNSKDCNGGAG